jgi:hypothetical protein
VGVASIEAILSQFWEAVAVGEIVRKRLSSCGKDGKSLAEMQLRSKDNGGLKFF